MILKPSTIAGGATEADYRAPQFMAPLCLKHRARDGCTLLALVPHSPRFLKCSLASFFGETADAKNVFFFSAQSCRLMRKTRNVAICKDFLCDSHATFDDSKQIK